MSPFIHTTLDFYIRLFIIYASITEARQLAAVEVTEDGQITRKIALTYNENGDIQETAEQYQDEAGVPYSTHIERYAYDAQGNLISSTIQETVEIGYGDIHYYEKQGLVCTSWVNSGTEVDTIYKLNGDFTKTHRGHIYSDGSCDWDDKPVTLAEYNSFFVSGVRPNRRHQSQY